MFFSIIGILIFDFWLNNLFFYFLFIDNIGILIQFFFSSVVLSLNFLNLDLLDNDFFFCISASYSQKLHLISKLFSFFYILLFLSLFVCILIMQFEIINKIRFFYFSLIYQFFIFIFILFLTGSFWSWIEISWDDWWFGEDIEEILLLILLFFFIKWQHFLKINIYIFVFLLFSYLILLKFSKILLMLNFFTSRHNFFIFYNVYNWLFILNILIILYSLKKNYFLVLRTYFFLSYNFILIFYIKIFENNYYLYIKKIKKINKLISLIFCLPIIWLFLFPIFFNMNLFSTFIFFNFFDNYFFDIYLIWSVYFLIKFLNYIFVFYNLLIIQFTEIFDSFYINNLNFISFIHLIILNILESGDYITYNFFVNQFFDYTTLYNNFFNYNLSDLLDFLSLFLIKHNFFVLFLKFDIIYYNYCKMSFLFYIFIYFYILFTLKLRV